MMNVMLKKYIYACLLAATTLFTISCSKKDLGNYDYHEINKVKFSDLNGTISADMLSQLKITPKVDFTMDPDVKNPDRYKYEWSYLTNETSPAKAILSTTKDLDYFVTLGPGNYATTYKITDKETGVEFIKRFQISVRVGNMEGWLLMTEVNGGARLDMLSKQADGSMVTVTGLYGNSNPGMQLKGKPRVVYSYDCGPLRGFGINLPWAIYLGTDQSTDRVHHDNYTWKPEYNVKKEMLSGSSLPEDFHVDLIKRVYGTTLPGSTCYMISSTGDLYMTATNPATKYGLELNVDATGKYKVAPFIGAYENSVPAPNATSTSWFYDITRKRFVKQTGPGVPIVAVPNPPLGNAAKPFLFPFVNTGMDLLYMNGVNKREVVAVLRDPVSRKCYWARWETGTEKQLAYQEIVSTDFDKAENLTVSNFSKYLFYNVGGKVYLYNPGTSLATASSREVFDYGASKVSAMKFQIYYTNFQKYPESETDRLLICSYDPALPEGKNGMLEKFDIQIAGAGLTKVANYTFSGFGKVQSFTYRERK